MRFFLFFCDSNKTLFAPTFLTALLGLHIQNNQNSHIQTARESVAGRVIRGDRGIWQQGGESEGEGQGVSSGCVSTVCGVGSGNLIIIIIMVIIISFIII